jgi:mRNA interferase MazF
MKRGEIWWANLAPPIGKRPVLLLTRSAVYGVRTSLTVAPVTRTVRNIPTEVSLGIEDGMPEKCVVNLDDLATIRKELLLSKITELTPVKISDVNSAIIFALDLQV